MNNLVAITIGDINGVGIHILINAWKRKKINNFILICNIKIFKNFLKRNNYKLQLNVIEGNLKKENLNRNKLNIYSFNCFSLEDNTYKSLKHSYDMCVNKICIGLINLPIRKDLIISKINKNFIGQTEFYQKINKKKYSNMILYHNKIKISPLTTHIKVKSIPKNISKKLIINQIINLFNTLKIDFNISSPKLIISGLNPHAGENGKLGNEEREIIIPSIVKLKKMGINVDGPKSADSMLIQKNLRKYDCFVFIFHDQALIPFKYISQFSGVNYTGNLDIIRTSPDHGTAYNLIGSKEISDKSLINCYKLIKKINHNRIINDES